MPRRNRNPKQEGTHRLDGWTSWAREIGERKGSPQPPNLTSQKSAKGGEKNDKK